MIFEIKVIATGILLNTGSTVKSIHNSIFRAVVKRLKEERKNYPLGHKSQGHYRQKVVTGSNFC